MSLFDDPPRYDASSPSIASIDHDARGHEFTYGDGRALDPRRIGVQGCCLCRRSITVLGQLWPQDDRMRQALIVLRRIPLPSWGRFGLRYGLCADHAVDPDLDAIEAAILRAAARVKVH